ncbi:MAG: septal ring factor EnvC (AmiA/AmiB activator) [Oceanospirillaceae bacterium]|jgi:septal ring factor EnvC (AmiA/AmiB activator)
MYSLLLILVVTITMGSTAVSAAQSVKKSQQQAQQLQRTLKKLQKELKQERSKRSAEDRALQKNDQSIAKIGQEISLINKALGKRKKKLQGYLANKKHLQQQLHIQQKKLNLLIKQRYQMGQQTPLKLLINQQDPEQVSRMLLYFEKIQAYQNQQVIDYRELLVAHKLNDSNIDKTEKQLLKDKERLQKEQLAQKNTRIQRKKNLQIYDARIGKKHTKIKKVTADRKRLQKVITRIERAVKKAAKVAKQKASKPVVQKEEKQQIKVVDNRPFKKLKGKLRWPAKGKVVRSFGSKENNLAYDGILIRASQGSAVKAVHTGKVVFADWLRSYGMVLIVDHGAGYLTLYGHNDQLNKKVGQKVFPGEIIALAGSSGGNQRSGLYFAIRRNGQTTNPKSWLMRR